MAATTNSKKSKKISAAQLRKKANQFLETKKNANLLPEILTMFDDEEIENFTPLLLTVELIFTQLLRRQDMYEIVLPMKPPDKTPEALHATWLRELYEIAMSSVIACFKRGDTGSRVQALVTAFKLLKEEGVNPMESCQGIICFPHIRLKNILTALLDSDESMSALIDKVQDYSEFRDIQQYGLKTVSLMAFSNSRSDREEVNEREYQALRSAHDSHNRDTCPNETFIQNYLELFEKLMYYGLPKTPRPYKYTRHKEDSYLCEKDGKVPFVYQPELCRRYINRCWGFACKWPLRSSERTHRRALVLLVDRIMPYLTRPQLTTDLLCDSLDSNSTISMLALRGMLELVTKHKIEYPDIYDRLYGMFEPEMFATRSKKRLIHLADVFLSSTRISEGLVAAFAKRLSRLALIASPEDANSLLLLVSSLVQRHPGLKRMLCHDQPAVMPKDPYVMEEVSATASRAIHSSLWEVAALRRHFTPEVSATASRVLAAADGGAVPDAPPVSDSEQFDIEVKKRFKTIEMNFVRAPAFAHETPTERLARMWGFTE